MSIFFILGVDAARTPLASPSKYAIASGYDLL
jgi:hypothetical protein